MVTTPELEIDHTEPTMRDTDIHGLDRTRDRPTYLGRPLADPTEAVFDQGLAFDIVTLLDRRQVLKALGLGGLAAGLGACTPGASASPSASAAASATAMTSANPAACALIPEETGGPFPGDGSNGPNLLEQSGVVRSDIRSSFGSSTTVADGVPLTVALTIQDLSDGCVPYAGAAVYLWQCDREGRYSMYSQGVEGENYLRGVQEADASGVVTYASIFPACYPGRWPHLHFEVYPSLDLATDAANAIATSQVAFPADICEEVYATDEYATSQQSFPAVSLSTDGVFGEDGGAQQLGTMSGSVADGLTIALTVPVASA